MDENNDKISSTKEMPKEQQVVEDVFSDLPNNNDYNSSKTINEILKEEQGVKYETTTPTQQAKIEPKITTYQPDIINNNHIQEDKSPKKFLFILILVLILIVGGFVIWALL